jgi:hypothetical protein
MVTPISIKVGEKAKIECCYKAACCFNCWPWNRKPKDGDISPITPKTLLEIEKAIEIFEKKHEKR